MKDKKQCEYAGCINLAKYSIYKTYYNGKKVWLRVCAECEYEIGDENMRRAGGRYEGKPK